MSRHAELLAEDERGRRAAQTEFEHPLLLEAGAGTGKTTTLIHRILAWSLGHGWLQVQKASDGGEDSEAAAPDRIAARVLEGLVAVTFTEAAAAEMAARVAEDLARVAGGEIERLAGFLAAELPAAAEPGLERRAAALLGAIDHLTVSTIHAWCRGLLANHAVDAGLHPDFGVDPRGERIETVAREVTEEAIRAAYGEGDRGHPLVRLAARGIGPRRVVAALTELARRALPASALAADPFARPVLDELTGSLDRALAALIEAAEPLAGQGSRALGPKVLHAARGTRAALDELPTEPMPRVILLAALLGELWPDNLSGRLKDWRKGKFNAGEGRELAGGATALASAAETLRPLISQLRQLDPRLLDAARRALEPLLAETARRLRSQGIASFDSLLLDARNLLAEHPDVRRQLRGGLRQLLVDEFQDTDRVQSDLVRLLGLRGEGRRPGLFVVGDPKQSIYGWRNADLGAYDAFAGELVAAGGRRHSLCRNFRSAPAILEEVERSVAPVMIAAAGLQPPFEPLLPSEKTRDRTGFREGRSAPVELWVAALGTSGRAADAEIGDEEAAELEAAAVAADIRGLHDEHGVPWREFGVLMRSGSRVDTFESALRAAAVPFTVSRDRQYYRRREVIDIAALVRTIVDPADHVALLAYLRSTASGLPDAALIPLWNRGFPKLVTELQRPGARRLTPLRELLAEVAAVLPADLPGLERVAGWELAVAAAVERLAELRHAFLHQPADRFVEQLRRLTLTEVTEAARYLGQFRAANLDRFFRDLEAALAERGGDVQAVLRALRRSLHEAVEPDEQRPRDPTENAAQVLTVHSAKGLEFGHVYLVQIHARTGGADNPVLDLDERWPSRERLEYTLFTSPTPGFHRVRQERDRVEAAERVRTLYVAMTRARERLVVVGRWPKQPLAGEVEAAEHHGDLLCCRAEPAGDLEALRARAADGRIDHAAARWVFLEPEAPPAAPAAAADRPSPLGADRIARDERRLEAHRRAAAKRMELPLGRPASQEAAARLEALRTDAPAGGQEAGERGAGGTAVAGTGANRDVALEVGVAIHRLFERWRFGGDPREELARGRARLDDELASVLPAALLGQARDRAGELLERIERGELLARFLEIGPAIRGREVPVLLPPDAAAVGFISGALDLLYADPTSGRLTIVDFKTDRVEGEKQIAERAAAYEPQEALYARAVQDALGLAEPPPTELWFLWPDRLCSSP